MKQSILHKFITTNPWLKLASVILAVTLWFFVVSKGRSVVTMDVPIRIKNVPAALEVVDKPKTISISIEGQERFLTKLREEDLRVVIDLGGVRDGEVSFPISEDNIELPKSFIVTKISPRTIKMLIETK